LCTSPITSYLSALAIGARIEAATAVGVLFGIFRIFHGSVFNHRPADPGSFETRAAEGISAEEP
jgi:hypothetical protein